MDKPSPLTPSQIRAGRALLEWSQDELAAAADVSLSTVRDYEKERRGDIDSVGTLNKIRSALENSGVVFLRSEGDLGPGVRLVAKAPNVLRSPKKLGRFNALFIPVEWRGQEVEVFVPQDVLDDLGRYSETRPDSEYIRLFEQRRAVILAAAAKAIDAGRVGKDRRVHLLHQDFPPEMV